MLSIVQDAPHPQSHRAPLLLRGPPHSPEADASDHSSCLKVSRLRPSWPPSNSSRICRGPNRTKLLLVERGCLQEAASLDPGGITLPPEHYVQMTTRPTQVLPRDRHVVRGRPRVSCLDGTKDCGFVCPLTTFQQEVGPSSSSEIREPFVQPALWHLTTPGRFVQHFFFFFFFEREREVRTRRVHLILNQSARYTKNRASATTSLTDGT